MHSAQTIEPLVSAHLVARRLRISLAEVRAWARARPGRDALPAYSIGRGGLRFRMSEVERWLDARRGGRDTVRENPSDFSPLPGRDPT